MRKRNLDEFNKAGTPRPRSIRSCFELEDCASIAVIADGPRRLPESPMSDSGLSLSNIRGVDSSLPSSRLGEPLSCSFNSFGCLPATP